MIANIVIGGAIFAYAGWMLVRYVKRSSKGKCASCSMADTCYTSCDTRMHDKEQKIIS